MFETNYRNSIPGYTGHVSTKVENDVPLINREARKHIPGKIAIPLLYLFSLGYGGYLAGVKSENVYGQTYGKISYQSTAGAIERGIDQAANTKYKSSFSAEFVKHSDKKFETTAEIVGVQRAEDTYKKVSFILTIYFNEINYSPFLLQPSTSSTELMVPRPLLLKRPREPPRL